MIDNVATRFQPIVDLYNGEIYGYESLAGECPEEVAYCIANGADLAQGYSFGKPSAEPVRKLG